MTIKSYSFGGSNSNQNPSPFSSLFALLFGIAFLVAFVFVSFELVTMLYKYGIVFLGIALFINYKVVFAYLTGIVDTFKTSVLAGLMKVGYNVLFYPFVFIWLILQGVFAKKVNQFKEKFENQFGDANTHAEQNTLTDAEGYTPYEEVKSELNKTAKERRDNSL